MTQQKSALSRSAMWLMTIAAGIAVANLYYCQPLLHLMQESLGGDDRALGWVPTLTQVGYAFGMMLLVPLGDLYERRRLIVISCAVSALALGGVALASSLPAAAVLSLVLGFVTVTPQLIVPFVAHLSPAEKRGQYVGQVMAGVLLGILLARTIAGFVGAQYGWRVQFGGAAVVMLGLALVLAVSLPVSEPTFRGTYRQLLRSVVEITKGQPVLREAMVIGGTVFGAFSAFWATLIHLMESPAFHLGARTVGLFGLLGAAGALAAPIVGRIADRKNPRVSIFIGLVLNFLSFLIYGFSGNSLLGLAIGVALMDVAVQACNISNQGRIYALLPEARSRVNTAYMFSYFVGGALGSYFATVAWSVWGWTGVCVTGALFLAVASTAFAAGRKSNHP